MTINPLIEQARAVDEDQTEDTGGFERRMIPAGPSLARFIGYVEVGKRTQKPYKGKAKPDAMEVRFSFELCSPQNEFVIGEGDDAKTVRDIIGIKITKKTGDRSGFVKLLKKMAYGRPDRLNFGSMLGEAFLINIVHNPGENSQGEKVIWANMKDENYNYLIGAPAQTDAITGKTTVFEVVEQINPLRLLLWDTPTTAQWDSIFIDGTRTVKVNGQEIEESKNWLQRDIISEALNFEGSPLHQMLSGLSTTATPMAGDKSDDPNEERPVSPGPGPANGPEYETHGAPPPEEKPVGAGATMKVASMDNTPVQIDAQNKAQAIFDKLGV